MERLKERIKTFKSIREAKKYYKKNLLDLHHKLINFYNSLFDTSLRISIEFSSGPPAFDPEKKKVIFGGLHMHETVANKLEISLKSLCFSSLANEEAKRYYFHVNPFFQKNVNGMRGAGVAHVIVRYLELMSGEKFEPLNTEIALLFLEGVGSAASHRALDEFGLWDAKLLEEKCYETLKNKKYYSLEELAEKGIPAMYFGFDFKKFFKVIRHFYNLSEKSFRREVRRDPREIYKKIF